MTRKIISIGMFFGILCSVKKYTYVKKSIEMNKKLGQELQNQIAEIT